MDSPFMFRARRGEGDVIGRCRRPGSATLRAVVLLLEPFRGIPNDVTGKLFRGMRFTGESGEDDGEGSERGDESVVDNVVVGDESADSEAWVELPSWCL